MNNNKNYTIVANSNGKVVSLTRENKDVIQYKEQQKEEYIVPYYFNCFHKRQERFKIANIILQCASYINLTTKESYKSISGFKPVSI